MNNGFCFLIPATCWCGETLTNQFYKGQWFHANGSVDVILGMCIKCRTVRTLSSSSESKVNYENKEVYNGLSYRHYKALQTISKYALAGAVLDIGCNSGEMLGWLKENCKKLNVFKGIDLNAMAINSSKKDQSLDLQFGRIENLGGKYENIIAIHVLEHIPDLESFFNNLLRLKKKQTHIYLCVPNIRSYNAKKQINLNRWGALNPMQHCWHFDKKTLRTVVQYFLPNSEVIYIGDSWIWQPRRILRLPIGLLFEGDQIEIVIKI